MTWNTDMTTAPRDGTAVHLTDGRYVTPARWISEPDDDDYTGWCCARYSGGGFLYVQHFQLGFTPTAWMPLPSPPETTP